MNEENDPLVYPWRRAVKTLLMMPLYLPLLVGIILLLLLEKAWKLIRWCAQSIGARPVEKKPDVDTRP